MAQPVKFYSAPMLVAPILTTDELRVARVQRPETIAHRVIPGDTRGTPGR
jgi:hypothetical protein